MCVQKLACLPSEHGGRLWQRKTSLMQWTRSSRDTRSSVRHPSTWCTIESTVLLHSLRKTLSAVLGCRIGDCIVNFISVIWAWTCIHSDYIAYHLLRTIVFLWVKLWKCIKLCFAITLFRDYFIFSGIVVTYYEFESLCSYPLPFSSLYACLLCFIWIRNLSNFPEGEWIHFMFRFNFHESKGI